MKEKPALVRCLQVAVLCQHRPIVSRLAALRADAIADSTSEYLEPAIRRPPLPRHGIISGTL
jgi:hypothetical protein